MEINKILYGIRHKESGLFYQSNDSDYDKFVEFNSNIDLHSKISLEDGWDYFVLGVPELYKEMFVKYLVEDSMIYEFYKVPPKDLELVKFEYSLKQVE